MQVTVIRLLLYTSNNYPIIRQLSILRRILMFLVEPGKIMPIIINALHECNPDVADHGLRISYSLYRILRQNGEYSDKQIHDICLTSALHDLGVHLTGEATTRENTTYTTLYGYAFASAMFPEREYNQVVIYHHFNRDTLMLPNVEYTPLARLIYALDYVDRMYTSGTPAREIYSYMSKYLDRRTANAIANVLEDYDNIEKQMAMDEGFNRVLYAWKYKHDDVQKLLDVLIMLVDFRSVYTIDHTVCTNSISRILSELLELPLVDRLKIVTGSMLHDLGNISIPLSIFDKPDKLTTDEMGIMRTHVETTHRIIDGYVSQDIVDIATRHHERLDGSGYSESLRKKQLTINEQVVAIADVFSALISERSYKVSFTKDEILGILRDMAHKRVINRDIVALCENHYDYIVAQMRISSQHIYKQYYRIKLNHKALMDYLPGYVDERLAYSSL